MDNYKGLYYKESKEQRFYEGGAHFSYIELYEILLYLKEHQEKKRKSGEQPKENSKNETNKNSFLSGINQNILKYDLFQNNYNINNINKNQPKTRNVVNNCFNNNPNTKIKKNLNKSNKQHLSIGISYNDKKHTRYSRNYNDFNLYDNRTTNQINNHINIIQNNNLSGIKNNSHLSNNIQKKILGKNNSTNQIKNKKFLQNIDLYNNLNNDLKINDLNDKNKGNESYIFDDNKKKINIFKSNNIEFNKNKINIKNNNKVRKLKSSSNKINHLKINNYINNGENTKKHRNNSGLRDQMAHSINNYINVNINNNNNINVNINNVNYKNNNQFKNKQINLNQILMSLIKSNDKKYQNQKIKEYEKKNTDSIFNHIKINKSRNQQQKSGLCHVKSMDYNNKPMNTDFLGTNNDTIYDKTFINNYNNRMNFNLKNNMPTQGNKLNWNYSYLKKKKDNIQKNYKYFKPITKDKDFISKNIFITKYNLKNNNYNNISRKKKKKNITNNDMNKNNQNNVGKYNLIKCNNNEILSKYKLYLKKINKK